MRRKSVTSSFVDGLFHVSWRVLCLENESGECGEGGGGRCDGRSSLLEVENGVVGERSVDDATHIREKVSTS